MKKALNLLIVILIIGIVVIGIFFLVTKKDAVEEEVAQQEEIDLDSGAWDNWRDARFNDVLTGKDFKVSDFKGQVILLESFAVWCPTCLTQQRQMKKLQDIDDSIVHISLDTDPNESQGIVKDHAQENNLDWHFAVSPNDITQALIDDFGVGVVNAPGAPVVVICADEAQSATLMPRGVKNPDDLLAEIDKSCN